MHSRGLVFPQGLEEVAEASLLIERVDAVARALQIINEARSLRREDIGRDVRSGECSFSFASFVVGDGDLSDNNFKTEIEILNASCTFVPLSVTGPATAKTAAWGRLWRI